MDFFPLKKIVTFLRGGWEGYLDRRYSTDLSKLPFSDLIIINKILEILKFDSKLLI